MVKTPTRKTSSVKPLHLTRTFSIHSAAASALTVVQFHLFEHVLPLGDFPGISWEHKMRHVRTTWINMVHPTVVSTSVSASCCAAPLQGRQLGRRSRWSGDGSGVALVGMRIPKGPRDMGNLWKIIGLRTHYDTFQLDLFGVIKHETQL